MSHIHKLADGAGFVAVDLDDAERSVGVVRCARKILQGGAANLARSTTYQMASFERKISGASGGFNADGDERDEIVSGLAAELLPLIESATFALDPAKGLSDEDLAPLIAVDTRGASRLVPIDGVTPRDRLIAAGVMAAITHVGGGRVAIEGSSQVVDEVRRLAGEAGATLSEADLSEVVDADVLVVGSKVGIIDHEVTERLNVRSIVPWGPLPITAKALAALRRAEVAALPDFVTTAGDLASWGTDGSDIDTRSTEAAAMVSGALGEVEDHPDGPLLGACYRAEAFLSTWQDPLPFGRPLA
ncbi:MAG: hypothetical protein IH940_09415 [Acidobacteria bacterium]|nr:hypothetical protein [Acidobacteriota bacterium]